jgi:hypothetical protein
MTGKENLVRRIFFGPVGALITRKVSPGSRAGARCFMLSAVMYAPMKRKDLWNAGIFCNRTLALDCHQAVWSGYL